ncbi:uncharacterized protein RAG0_07875 [Rhynchosporium agropyri]|uniref:Uncharacterized protein n=1 Tax=Rhynchosporium agropyri TaxID=914238 RepID=A0A1E1KN94_9HELO|nr:uncharacterized protein RAG0_07875 [Rhynchosporium agropyri]
MALYRLLIIIIISIMRPIVIDLYNRGVDQLRIYGPNSYLSNYASYYSCDYLKGGRWICEGAFNIVRLVYVLTNIITVMSKTAMDYETTSQAKKKASKSNKPNLYLLNASEDISTLLLLGIKVPELL